MISPTTAVNIIIAHNIPKLIVGIKLLRTRTPKPIHRMTEEVVIARPFKKRAVSTDFERDIFCDFLVLYSERKCMVSSTTIPIATAKIKAVAVLRGIPAAPITPKFNMIGNRFGIKLKLPIDSDLRARNMMILIVQTARLKL